jgi:hypothetical protein
MVPGCGYEIKLKLVKESWWWCWFAVVFFLPMIIPPQQKLFKIVLGCWFWQFLPGFWWVIIDIIMIYLPANIFNPDFQMSIWLKLLRGFSSNSYSTWDILL